MKRLRDESQKKCFSILRKFINGSPQDERKGTAILALDQLHRITAGTDSVGSTIPLAGSTVCSGRPRANEAP